VICTYFQNVHLSRYSTNAWYSEHDVQFLEKELLESFTVNVVGVTKTITAFLPLIKRSKIKKVITISTGMADLGKLSLSLSPILILRGVGLMDNQDAINSFSMALSPAYSISKAALNVLVAKYNAVYSSQDILFMSISPGFVDTSEGKQSK
jgi:NAD(P)-dependent dehydrogenase (short-subunit alcohol dehydrogenase family)